MSDTEHGPSWQEVAPCDLASGDVVALYGRVHVVVGRRTDGRWLLEDGDGGILAADEPSLLRLKGGWAR